MSQDVNDNMNAEKISPQAIQLVKSKHTKYLSRMLKVLPECLSSMETTRMTLVYFCISALDVLEEIDKVLSPEDKASTIKWIYSLQIKHNPEHNTKELRDTFCNGFRGSTFACIKDELDQHSDACGRNDDSNNQCYVELMDSGHLAMTYTALATLIILGDDLSQVDRASISAGLQKMQQPDGSFTAAFEASENDMRFVYCACAVAYMIDDWSGVDKDATVKFISSSISHEGGFGQGPNLEAHGGSTYCAVASLALMGKLDNGSLTPSQIERCIRWCVFRLNEGFQGRPNKPDDTCYTFWIGATLRVLTAPGHEIEAILKAIASKSHQFVLSTQDGIIGGMAKWPDLTTPDPLHTYLGLSGMSLFLEPNHNVFELSPVDAALNITKRAADHLSDIKKRSYSIDCNHS